MDILHLANGQSLVRALFCFIVVYAAARGVGRRLCIASDSIHLHALVGFNCLGLIALLLGFFSQPVPLVVTMLLAALFTLLDAKELKSELGWFVGSAFIRPTRRRLLLNLGCLFTLGPALTYPSGLDELTYHIELPRRWMEAGKLTVQADLPYSSLPSLSELISWLSSPMEHLITPRLINWVVWTHGVLLLTRLAEKLGGPTPAASVGFAFAASPVVLMVSANCYVECFIFADAVAVLFLMIDVSKADSAAHELSIRRTVVIGVLLGGAIATKMTAAGLLLLPMTAFLPSKQRFELLPRMAFLIAVAVAFALPFYLRSWIQCGNPLAPYYAHWFTEDAAVIEVSHYHHAIAVGNFGIPGIVGVLAAPIALAFASEVYDGVFGLQWLVLVGLALIGIRLSNNRKLPYSWLLLTSILLVVWSATSQQVRFALPAYVLVCGLASIGLGVLSTRTRRWSCVGLIVASLVSFPWMHVGYYLDSWLCVIGVRTPAEYIRDGVGDGYSELTVFAHEKLDGGEKVVTLFEHRLAYLPKSIEIATPFFQAKYFRAAQKNSNPESIIAELKAQQVKYVIFTGKPPTPDVSPKHIELQQQWFQAFDQCIADGKLKVVWRSYEHAVVSVE